MLGARRFGKTGANPAHVALHRRQASAWRQGKFIARFVRKQLSNQLSKQVCKPIHKHSSKTPSTKPMTVKPETLGMCSARLARIDKFLAEAYISPGRLPCAQLQISRAGQLLHHSVLGQANLETGAAMTEDTLVRLYSMTKPVTSVAFMMLVEQGLVALDDPVHKFIPAWKDLRVYVAGLPGTFQTQAVAEPMRIVDLLRHTAGLTYGFQTRTNVDAAYRANRADVFEHTDSLEPFIAALGALPLEFSPGSAWNYSVATDVLGYLVSKISGMPFDEYLRSKIFEPLGMVDTAFHVSEDKARRFAQCYVTGNNGKIKPVSGGRNFLQPTGAPSGGGGLVGTASDYMRFCDMLRQGGTGNGHRLIGPKTLHLMRQNHLPGGKDLSELSVSMFSEATYNGVGFGLGFAITHNPTQTLLAGSPGEYWWGGMASTAFWVDPVEDISVVFLTQLVPSSSYPIRRELRSMVNAAVIDSKVL